MDTVEFLRRHFADLREDEVIEIRCVFEPKGTKPVIQRYFKAAEQAAAFALRGNERGYHAYYGANPRSTSALDAGKRGKEAVARAAHIWVDIDCKDQADRDEALGRIDGFPIEPNTLVDTGGGYQAIWGFAQGFHASPLEQAEELMSRLADRLGGDRSVAEAARVLRLPGTVNHKPKYPKGTHAEVRRTHDEYREPVEFWYELPREEAPPATPSPSPDTVDKAEFYDALAAIDPWSVGYDEWLRILMAIHAYDSTMDGLIHAVTWADGKPGEVETKWRSFRRDGSNPATVFHFAREAGWRPGRKPLEYFFGRGGAALDAETPPSERRPRPGPNISLVRLADFFAEEDDGPQWLIEGLLNAGGISLLVAKPKVGKSTFAANLAVAVAAGLPFMGHATVAGPVHVYSLEVHRAFVRQQYQQLCAAYGLATPPNILIHAATGIVEKAFDQIAEIVMREKPKLVILDTLSKVVDTIKDGNNYLEVYEALRPVIALAEDSGAHIVCVHHANKGLAEGADAVMGSVGYAASVDLTMMLKRDREANIRTLSMEARFLPESDPVAFDFDHDRKLVLLGDRDNFLRDTAEARILAAVKAVPGMNASEIKAATGVPDGVVGPTIHKLAQTHRLTAEGSPKRYTIVEYVAGAATPGPEQGAFA